MTDHPARRGRARFGWIGILIGCFVLTAVPGRAEVRPEGLPALTDRVVDGANLLQPGDLDTLKTKLRDLETQSGIQFVVATVASLQGEEIEPYANALFRQWRLGQKDKNNGLLFLIAPNEHHARFEVGYGLEGTMTDALSKLILRNAVTPKFKAGDFPGGIKAGVDEAIAVLTTDKSSWQKRPALAEAADQQASPAAVLFFFVVFLVILVIVYRNRRSISWGSAAGGFIGGSMSGGGGGSSRDSGGDSFSGGGGDSGGGGSSDNW